MTVTMSIWNQDQGTDTSRMVTGLPINGSTIYVRLWTLLPAGWQFTDYTYAAAVPVITLVSPNSGQQGQANLNVAVTGQFTHFVQGQTAAGFGAGITVNSTTVTDATHATANVTIAAGAALGTRTVTLTTNSETAVLANGFTVTPGTPVITLVAPNSGPQGQANLNVAVTGQFTHFAQGVTMADVGAGLTVNSTTVTDATHATAKVTIAVGAALGTRTVTLTTGSEVAALANSFTVTLGIPELTQVTPSGARLGQANLMVGLITQFTHFVQGTTVANFGAGITVNSMAVLSATQATANVTIAGNAALGLRIVTLTTGGEVVSLNEGFAVAPLTLPIGDFEGDGKSDLTLFRPADGTWNTMRSSTGTPTAFAWGNSSDKPVLGDFDDDGRNDIAVFRPSNGTWYVVPSSTGVTYGFPWGNSADIPVPGDYDNDRKTDIAVFRPSNGTWYVVPSTTGIVYSVAWGNGADTPASGDYDGDGKTDIAVFRPSNGTWYVVPSTTGLAYGVAWGNSADRPVAADYDGDGRTDIAVFRPSNGTWYIVPSTTGVPYGFAWGSGADIAVPADYDGDRKTDIAVFRPSNGTWYIVPSTTGVAYGFAWGTSADIPIFRRP